MMLFLFKLRGRQEVLETKRAEKITGLFTLRA